MTPMKEQYYNIKKQYSDCLLFFRLGDFYEMFDDDAKLASRELDLTLTTRDKNVEDVSQRTPMCGVPYHSAEAYISRLVAKGYKVAICEQTEDPATAKGIVNRDVVRVITPGTVTEESMLDEGRPNYACAVFLDAFSGAAAFCDVSTGEFCVSAFESDASAHLKNELSRFSPKEAILSLGASTDAEIPGFLELNLGVTGAPRAELFNYVFAAAQVCERFSAKSPDELKLGDSAAGVCAAGALLSYLAETQKRELSHINRLELISADSYMEMDFSTKRGLELCESQRGEKEGTLLWVLDHTKTPMGGRLIRSWIERPLLSPVAINKRLAAVNELYLNHVLRAELMLRLKEIGDMRRITSRAVYGSANGRDILALGNHLSRLPGLFLALKDAGSQALKDISSVDPQKELGRFLRGAICDEPPFSLREGGILREGFSAKADSLRRMSKNGAEMIAALESRERERSGIKKLKVGYNKVFGYYLDVPRSSSEAVPEDYIRKQTLVSSERYFTEELKNLETDLLGAKERLAALEYELFCDIRERVAGAVQEIQAASDAVAELDVLCSLAEVASRNGYTMPTVDLSPGIRIIEGRHPVVEQALPDTLFVPNDTLLDDGDNRIAIITGPNMAGKSTYMRQTALIVLMAQMGSFVPARSAALGVVDRVFTRIGAADNLAAGQSTFMVEMSEVSHILRYATKKSLLILDEIGRGTSTYDGMAVARAILEYCADKRSLGAKTMFATHYHELSALQGTIDGVCNYNISARKQDGELIFLRKIVPGAADDSYGIEVAKLAGVPSVIIDKAGEYLLELEGGEEKECAPANPEAAREAQNPERMPEQISFSDAAFSRAYSRLCSIDPNTLSPIEALGMLFEIKKEAGDK